MGRGQRGERISILKTAVLIFIFIKHTGGGTDIYTSSSSGSGYELYDSDSKNGCCFIFSLALAVLAEEKRPTFISESSPSSASLLSS